MSNDRGRTHDGEHVDPSLLAAAVVGDELSDKEQRHIDRCAMCSHEIAALGRAANDVRASGDIQLVSPPAWLEAAIFDQVDATAGGGLGQPDSPRRINGLASRSTARSGQTVRSGRFGAGWLVAACLASLLLGGIVGTVLTQRSNSVTASSPTATPTTVATADLDTLDASKQRLGSARLVRGDRTLDVDVDTPGFSANGGYLEVWLINKDLTRMVSIGVLSPEQGTASFPVDQTLIDQGYTIVDISREPFDDKPQHSGDSLVRGTLN